MKSVMDKYHSKQSQKSFINQQTSNFQPSSTRASTSFRPGSRYSQQQLEKPKNEVPNGISSQKENYLDGSSSKRPESQKLKKNSALMQSSSSASASNLVNKFFFQSPRTCNDDNSNGQLNTKNELKTNYSSVSDKRGILQEKAENYQFNKMSSNHMNNYENEPVQKLQKQNFLQQQQQQVSDEQNGTQKTNTSISSRTNYSNNYSLNGMRNENYGNNKHSHSNSSAVMKKNIDLSLKSPNSNNNNGNFNTQDNKSARGSYNWSLGINSKDKENMGNGVQQSLQQRPSSGKSLKQGASYGLQQSQSENIIKQTFKSVDIINKDSQSSNFQNQAQKPLHKEVNLTEYMNLQNGSSTTNNSSKKQLSSYSKPPIDGGNKHDMDMRSLDVNSPKFQGTSFLNLAKYNNNNNSSSNGSKNSKQQQFQQQQQNSAVQGKSPRLSQGKFDDQNQQRQTSSKGTTPTSNNQKDQKEYQRLHEKLNFLENKILSIKNNIDSNFEKELQQQKISFQQQGKGSSSNNTNKDGKQQQNSSKNNSFHKNDSREAVSSSTVLTNAKGSFVNSSSQNESKKSQNNMYSSDLQVRQSCQNLSYNKSPTANNSYSKRQSMQDQQFNSTSMQKLQKNQKEYYNNTASQSQDSNTNQLFSRNVQSPKQQQNFQTKPNQQQEQSQEQQKQQQPKQQQQGMGGLGALVTQVNLGSNIFLGQNAKKPSMAKQSQYQNQNQDDQSSNSYSQQQLRKSYLNNNGNNNNSKQSSNKMNRYPPTSPTSPQVGVFQTQTQNNNNERQSDKNNSNNNNQLSILNTSAKKKQQQQQQQSYTNNSFINQSQQSLQGKIRNADLFYVGQILKAYTTNLMDNEYMMNLARDHLVQSMQALSFARMLKPIGMQGIQERSVYLPKTNKKTIVFDLDETLIHCNESANIPSDVVLPIQFPSGDVIEAGINIRPYTLTILKELYKMNFEIIVFTASHSCYANVVLDYLDPKNQYISCRLFRENCVQTPEGVYIKDLRVLQNRNLNDVLIVDNASYSFGFQLDNGIPIIPFYDNKEDIELKYLLEYLKMFQGVGNVRTLNKQLLKIHQYDEFSEPEELVQQLYNTRGTHINNYL